MTEAKIKKGILRRYVQNALFEEDVVSFASIDQAHPQPKRGFASWGGEDELELTDVLPVDPSEEMATQLSTERPPIEDEDYIPSNSKELGHAANLVAQLVPDDEVEYFYQRLNVLLDQAIARHHDVETLESDEGEIEELEKNENFSPSHIRDYRMSVQRVIKEIGQDGPLYGEEKPEADVEDIDWMGDEGDEPPLPPETSLDDLASQFGYSTASGARQDIERILKRLGFTVENVPMDQIESLRTIAVSEFVQLMLDNDFIEEADATELQDNPQQVAGMDSFRFFFTSGFVLPAFQKILRDSRKNVDNEIEKLGVPQKSKQTILNQAFGDTPRNSVKLIKKIRRDAAGEGIVEEDTADIIKRVENMFPKLVSLAKLEGDLIGTANSLWQRAGNAKKIKILNQALQSTSAHQDPFSK